MLPNTDKKATNNSLINNSSMSHETNLQTQNIIQLIINDKKILYREILNDLIRNISGKVKYKVTHNYRQ